MNPHRRRWIIIRIATITMLALAFSGWYWRNLLPDWPERPIIPRPYAAWQNLGDLSRYPADELRPLEAATPIPLLCGPTFEKSIDALRDRTDAPIFVNWKEIEPLDRDTPVSADVGGLKLGDAISKLLQQVDPGNGRLCFTVDERVIAISTREDLARNLTTRVYDIRDLVDPEVSRPFTSMFGKPQTNSPPWTLARKTAVDAVTDRAMRAVAAESWRNNGSAVGSIQELGGQLIVTQTYDNQRLIAHQVDWMKWRNLLLRWCARSIWIVTPAAALATALELALARRSRLEAMRGRLCLACGYDLRFSSLRCPECGRPIDRPRRPNVADPVITS